MRVELLIISTRIKLYGFIFIERIDISMKKKLLPFCLAMFLALTACNQEDTSDTAGGIDDLLEGVTTPTTTETSEKTTETSEIEIEETFETATEAVAQEFDNSKVDYGGYLDIVKSYQIAFAEEEIVPREDDTEGIYDVAGFSFAKLIDFNGDDIYELVVARNYEEDFETLESFNGLSENKVSLLVYTLGEDSMPVLISEFLYSHEGDKGTKDKLSFRISVVEGVPYIVYVNQPTYTEPVSVLTFHGYDGEYGYNYYPAISLTEYYIEEDIYYAINYEEVDFHTYLEEYEKWTGGEDEVYVIGGSTPDDREKLQKEKEETLEFLSNYEQMYTQNDTLNYYTSGRFVLNEYNDTIYQSIYDGNGEGLIDKAIDYLRAVASEDYTKFSELKADVEHEHFAVDELNENRENEYFIPSYIIHDAAFYYPHEYGYESVMVSEDAYLLIDELGLEDHYMVKLEVDEVEDKSLSEFGPQIAYGNYNYWFLFASEDSGETYQIYGILTEKFHWNPAGGENPFHVQIMAYPDEFYYNENGEVDYNKVEENLRYYLTDEEIYMAEVLFAEKGTDYYLITNVFDTEMKIYDYDYDNSERGELIYTTKPGNPLILRCNEEFYKSNVEVVYTGESGIEYSYFPSRYEFSGADVGRYGQIAEYTFR